MALRKREQAGKDPGDFLTPGDGEFYFIGAERRTKVYPMSENKTAVYLC